MRAILLALLAAMIFWLLSTYQPQKAEVTLSIGGPFEFTSQDLAKDGYIYTRMQVAETLVSVGSDGTLLPMLAEQWQVSDDGLSWRFMLRPQVRFHDNSLLSIEDALHSLNVALGKPGPLAHVPLNTLSIDGNSLVFNLSRPYRPLAAILAHYSTAILAPASFDEQGQVKNLIATGPYQTQLLAPPHKLETRRFNNYWGHIGEIEYAHYLTGHRAESRALQAQTGDADLIYTLDPASLNLLDQSPHLSVQSESLPRTLMLKLNNAHPYLDHPDVRQAISLALDRTGIAEQVIRVPGSEANQLFPPSLVGWHHTELPPLTRDLDRARELLARQGWELGPMGVLERGWDRFGVRLITYADRPELTVVATAIQAQLREIGIAVFISVDNASAVPAGHHDGSLEMALIARNYGMVADPLALLLEDTASFHGSDWGHMYWGSETLNELLAEMSAVQQSEPYNALAGQVSSLLAKQLPLIPITFYTQQVSVNERVQGFQFDPFELNYRINQMQLTPDGNR
ncbi:ABC transporter substrate-binding protein [Ferrimonas pelagia]|uniref:ABC transporter substrate-binding protein n=1 Tax=Ferrimonas pelagia TaxID=1177826 RepID=A0ABP9EI96_9GAMM